MTVIKKQKSYVQIALVCASFLAILSFILPLYTIQFLGKYSYTGLDNILYSLDTLSFPEFGVTLCLICSVIGALSSLAAMKKAGFAGVTALTAVIGMVLMIIIMSDDSDIIKPIDYAAVGFYLYEIAGIAETLLSAAVLYYSKTPISLPKTTSGERKSGTVKKEILRCQCGAVYSKGDRFCVQCGKNLCERSTKAAEPLTKSDRNAICPSCGARQSSTEKVCKYCKTPMR